MCTSASFDKNLQDGGKPFVLTTPLYYINAPPHMGSWDRVEIITKAGTDQNLQLGPRGEKRVK